MKKIKIIRMVFIMMYLQVITASAADYSFTIYENNQKFTVSEPVNSTQVIFPGGVQVTQEQTVTEDWTMEYDHQILIIPMGDLNVPVEINKPEVSLMHEDKGLFVFSENKRGQSTIIYNIHKNLLLYCVRFVVNL